jgi:hypothetical protein
MPTSGGRWPGCPDHPPQPLTWRLRTDKARTRRSINRAKRTTRRGRSTPPRVIDQGRQPDDRWQGYAPSRVGSTGVASEAGWAGQRCAGRLERLPSGRRESSAMPWRSVRPGNAPATLRQPSPRTLEPAGHKPSQLRRGPAGRRSGSNQQHLAHGCLRRAPHPCLTPSSADIGCGVAGGRSRVGGARRRGRNWVAVRRAHTGQRPRHKAADQRVWWRAARDSNPQPPDP